MDEMWMKPTGGSTGSNSDKRVAYATCAESLTPSARVTQARVPRDLRHSASAGDVAERKQHQFRLSGRQRYLWYPTARTWSPTLVSNVAMRATRRRSIEPART
jgi:hypothetical protein